MCPSHGVGPVFKLVAEFFLGHSIVGYNALSMPRTTDEEMNSDKGGVEKKKIFRSVMSADEVKSNCCLVDCCWIIKDLRKITSNPDHLVLEVGG